MKLDEWLAENEEFKNLDYTKDVYAIEHINGLALVQGGRRNHAQGYVYILETHPNIFKIGMSKDYKIRHKQLSIVLPFETKVRHVIETDDMVFGEKFLHGAYQDKRLRGEWFNLPENEIARLETIGDMFWMSPQELSYYLELFG